MAMICDGVVANMTSLYLGVIAVMKLFSVITGRNFSGCFVVLVSTFVVASIVLAALTWDVSRKPTYAAPLSADPYCYYADSTSSSRQNDNREKPRGICWHDGVSVQSTVSQIRFQLPQQPLPFITTT
ncbi:hypothetical protein IFM89_001149 [Coptis chinensis]|uniref:Uncharacterized protein n=1 Tax=Coptis chinensis TaxID=261450 RepID=A0A835IIJ3_9MAGN|nr:hypothetical protein IFM89_001149 [Coptis chinensis]